MRTSHPRRCVAGTDAVEVRGLLSGAALADELAYVRGVAERVSQEGLRRQTREQAAVVEMRRTRPVPAADEIERRVPCLKSCLRKLPADSRALILAYYEGEGSADTRRLLAERLGISYGNLKIRAHRIRGQLETDEGFDQERATIGSKKC